MVSGLALLMDVYQPENGNNIGIIVISGSAYGFYYPKTYNEADLKVDYSYPYVGEFARELVNKGYTVFMINHRFAPKFKYPDGLEDCRRAVRFIRYNASKYKINPTKIGAFGHSSGAYFSSMLGLLDTTYPNPDKNPIDSVSSKVQAVVTLASPFVLSDYNGPDEPRNKIDNEILLVTLSYLGELPAIQEEKFVMSGKFIEASPVTYVSKGDAPMLIYSSDNDAIAPQRQVSVMVKKLIENNVIHQLVIDPKAGHGPKPDMNEVDKWFKKYLTK
jgi:acetyl esterase/lipase